MRANKKIYLKDVGTRIRQWRKSKGMKIEILAKTLSISQGSLSEIETNKSLPSADTVGAFHYYTDIDIIWMLTGGFLAEKKRVTTQIINLTKDHPGLLIKRA